MKEIDDIDNLFSSVLGDEKIVPPTAVKSSIDAELFGGTLGGRLIWLLIPLLLLVVGTGAYFWMQPYTNETNTKLTSNNKIENQVDSKSVSVSSEDGNGHLNLNDNRTILNESEQELDYEDNSFESINSTSNKTKTNNSNSNLSNRNITESINDEVNDSKMNTVRDNLFNYSTEVIEDQNNEIDVASSSSIMNESELSLSEINSKSATYDGVEKNVFSRGALQATDLEQTETSSDNELGSENSLNLEQTKTLKNVDVLAIKSIEKVTSIANRSIAPSTTVAKPIRKNLFAASIYIGVNQGVDFQKPTIDNYFLKERLGMQQSIELSYALAPRIDVATGIDYLNYSDVYSNNTSTTISTLESSYYDYTMAYDTILMDSVAVDSAIVNVYSNTNNTSTEDVRVLQTAISLPLYFQYSWNLSPLIKAKLSTGVLVSYWSNRVEGGATDLSLVKRRVGFSMMTRPEISYNGLRLGVGVYGRIGYDFVPIPAWKVASRQRFNIGGGIFLRYQL